VECIPVFFFLHSRIILSFYFHKFLALLGKTHLFAFFTFDSLKIPLIIIIPLKRGYFPFNSRLLKVKVKNVRNSKRLLKNNKQRVVKDPREYSFLLVKMNFPIFLCLFLRGFLCASLYFYNERFSGQL